METGKDGSASPPDHIQPLVPKLLLLLIGCSPIDSHLFDGCCWGGSYYFVKIGFQHLLADSPGPPRSKLEAHIWQGASLPKINAFFWITVQGKLLTIEKI